MACSLLSKGNDTGISITACTNVTHHTEDGEITILAEEIADYISAHPNAADSLEGITKWWLMRQRLERASMQVQKALDYLVREGVLDKQIKAGKIVYTKKP